MNWNIEGTKVVDMEMWELAQRLTDNAPAPQTAISCVFTGIMQSLQSYPTNAPITDSIRRKVWENCAQSKVHMLKQTLIAEFCSKILRTFSSSAIHHMLVEHTRTGSIHHPLYSPRLQAMYQLNIDAITNVVAQKGSSLATSA